MPDADEVYVLDRLHALLQQEATQYRLSNYIEDPTPRPRHPGMVVCLQEARLSPCFLWEGKYYIRQRMVRWVDNMIKAYGVSRQVAAYATFYMDRYFSRYSTSELGIKLVTVASLHLAFKIHEPWDRRRQVASIHDSCKMLGRGVHVGDLERMEVHMLEALDWRMHPPIPEIIAELYLRILNRCFPNEDHAAIHDECIFCLDQALLDNFFLGYAPTVLTMAAFCNTIQPFCRSYEQQYYEGEILFPHPLHELYRVSGIYVPFDYFMDCHQRIGEIMQQWMTTSSTNDPYERLSCWPPKPSAAATRKISPVSIVQAPTRRTAPGLLWVSDAILSTGTTSLVAPKPRRWSHGDTYSYHQCRGRETTFSAPQSPSSSSSASSSLGEEEDA